MTKYIFKINDKFITIQRKTIQRKPNRPTVSREHLEGTMSKWCILDNLSSKQRISMRGWILQTKNGHVSRRIACGQGRYKVIIHLSIWNKSIMSCIASIVIIDFKILPLTNTFNIYFITLFTLFYYFILLITVEITIICLMLPKKLYIYKRYLLCNLLIDTNNRYER